MKFIFYYRSPDSNDATGSSEPENNNEPFTSSSTDSDTIVEDPPIEVHDTTTTDTEVTHTTNETDDTTSGEADHSIDSSSTDTSEGKLATSPTDETVTDDTTNVTTNETDTASTTSAKDSEGFAMLTSGTWNSSTKLNVQGGQVMHFEIKNVNVLGTTLSIESNLGGKKSLIIAPTQTVDLRFDCFGNEPMGWRFNISTNSDAFIVAWKLFSSWVPGDPPNK